MNRICVGIFATATVLAGITGVWPLPVSAADEAGRYTMRQTESGFLRLDTQTGAVSVCTSETSTWSCKQVRDDSRALHDEISELSRQNKILKAEIDRLKGELRVAEDREPKAGFSSDGGIPSEQEVDKAFTFVERLLKRFKSMVEDLRDERPNGTQL